MASFAYQGDRAEVVCFGVVFPRGVVVQVTDAVACRKLAGNRDFCQVFDGVEVLPSIQPAPKRRGRPPKVT